MPDLDYLETVQNRAVHLTGVKGTGVAAIAEVLAGEGARVSGSDVSDVFYTDELLARIGLVPRVGFAPDHIPQDTSLLVYSAAYGPDNPERREAERRGIPQMSYAETLGMLSRSRLSLGVSGVHGKTTTTAMLGTMVAGTGLPVTVIVGSAVPSFGGSATLRHGKDLLIAETCEYRRHFLEFAPTVAIITNVESDHQDYYPDESSILRAFEEYAASIKPGGALVYCEDDPGAREIAHRIRKPRPDITCVPYGFTAPGRWRCTYRYTREGAQYFSLPLLDDPSDDSPADSASASATTSASLPAPMWKLLVPGRHMIVNATAAVAALTELLERYKERSGQDSPTDPAPWRASLEHFRGTRRRSEIVARVREVTIIDDYAHHPTAIATTLEGIREFYPDSRIIVDFMSHTYSRTAALLAQFGSAFNVADVVVLNDIYASAREHNVAGITGEALYRAVAERHPRVYYQPDFEEAARLIRNELREGDVFITMGAGDNFRIGRRVAELLHA